MATELTAVQPLWAGCDLWLRRAEQVITASADALDTLNVFPVSDADTGSNLKLTLRGIAQAVPTFDRDSLDAIAQAAILSAHGNSGAILAEMVASVCRSLEHQPHTPPPLPHGSMVALLLRRVAVAATQAVAAPVAGTILTVADRAADAAERAAEADPGDALAVAAAAQSQAREALQRTPEQLGVLARAGVVDAGGQAFVLLLDVVVEVLGGPTAEPLLDGAPPRLPEAHGPGAGVAGCEYEVMYAIRGAPRASLDLLRSELSVLGHSVVIVGDQSVAQVHVHLSEPGVAVEAGLGLGTLSQIRITALPGETAQGERTVLSLVAGDGLGDAVRELGGVPVPALGGQLTVQELTATLARSSGDAVILPNDMESLEIARHLAGQVKADGRRRVAVIPTVAQVQGLAALAVHEPTADFDSAVVAMSTAAAHTRQGAVTIAESAAMTMAGRCRPGDVLGVVEGDFVEIGSSVPDVADRVIQRLLGAGGELVTLVLGAGVTPDLADELERRTLAAGHQVDVETLVGGQDRYLVLVGVE
ncbi:MAG TPA: DAK2 domain-containing protein [Propionibacteriaceae bacterium]